MEVCCLGDSIWLGWENGLQWIKMREIGKILWLLLHPGKPHIGQINPTFAIRVREFWENVWIRWSGWERSPSSWKWQCVFCLVVEERWKDFKDMWRPIWMPSRPTLNLKIHFVSWLPQPGIALCQALSSWFCPSMVAAFTCMLATAAAVCICCLHGACSPSVFKTAHGHTVCVPFLSLQGMDYWHFEELASIFSLSILWYAKKIWMETNNNF